MPAKTIDTHAFAPYAGDAGGRTETVTVEVEPRPGSTRRFTLTTTQPQRDDTPRQRVVEERAGGPRVDSGSPLFDALFAMAVDDARLNSVGEIRDAAYNGGRPIACDCFQTGEQWHYVWTRDLAYAVNLGLAWLDPQRSVNALRFKTSAFREGVAVPPGVPAGSLQIVQDTGSGGSWPVSTDRVSWAWGAESALHALPPAERAAFGRLAYRALRGTLEADRLAAFDARAGLYGGEQSFLDWRTQSYAPWIVHNLSRMSASKSLSTNVGHYQALRLAAALAAEQHEPAAAERYGRWAADLKAAVNRVFWLDDVQQYASLTSDDSPPVALHQFDLLGTALAVVSGVAPPERAALALANYPQAPFGPPVIAPQQAHVPVYHNRAIWPFVTGYALRAAATVRNPAVAAHAFDSLQRGAALNLSNMENLEWLTGLPRFDDGPVINSRRQLWSVAAYLSLVVESVFGLHLEPGGIRLAPFLTATARRALGPQGTALLSGLRIQGHAVSIRLRLPSAGAEGAEGHFPLTEVKLNGQPVAPSIVAAQLGAGPNEIELGFGALVGGEHRLLRVPPVPARSHDDPRVFAPGVPVLRAIEREGRHLRLDFTPPAGTDTAPLRYDIYRDGRRVAKALATTRWHDPEPLSEPARRTYAVEAIDTRSGHRSHLSEPVNHDGDGALRPVAVGEWFDLPRGGWVGFELLYDNRAGHIETGVTNAVKQLRLRDAAGREAARGVVQMPHLDDGPGSPRLGTSTMLRVHLPAGRYQLDLLDFFNMGSLQANAGYQGRGGVAGPHNEAGVHAIRLVRLPQAN